MNVDIDQQEQRERVGTDGLASAYQRTNVTTVGVLAVMETGGYMLVGVTAMPGYLLIPLGEPSVGIQPRVVEQEQDELANGYKAMAAKNKLLAEEYLPFALEDWPMWEDR